jgi:hypothetical protein
MYIYIIYISGKEVLLEKRIEATMDEATVEREFWYTMSSSSNFTVQYANDIEGTASSNFDDWNLSTMPTSPQVLS